MKLLKQLAKIDLLVIDDGGLAAHTGAHRRDLLDVLDDRHGSITGCLPVEHWHAAVGDATAS